MAESDEKFDPNDLESIDALLDEAELEAAESLGDELDVDDVNDALNELESLDDVDLSASDNADLDADDLLDTLGGAETAGVAEVVPELIDNEAEVVAVSEPLQDELPPVGAGMANTQVGMTNNNADQANQLSQQNKTSVDDTDNFLAKRASAQQAAKTSNLSAEDMDSIKKLIIIFGSILLVLALTGIGIGVWSALSASAAGMSDETKSLIEAIQVNSERNNALISDSRKTVQEVEKKLDAINFQINQLNEDVTLLADKAKADPIAAVMPIQAAGQADVVNGQPAKTAEAAKVAPVVATQPLMAAAVDPEVLKNMALMNTKLIKAQRSLDEVNKRIKQMQSQYSAMMHSVKVVEKQTLVEQKEKEDKLAEQQAKQQKAGYQYNAPEGVFYDQANPDSYP